jgi:hypothetical protein
MVTKDSPSTSHTSETAAQQHMQTNSQPNPSQYSTTQKQKQKKNKEIQSTNEIANNHMGSIQDPKYKDSKKALEVGNPMRGEGLLQMMTDTSHAKYDPFNSIQLLGTTIHFECWDSPPRVYWFSFL